MKDYSLELMVAKNLALRTWGIISEYYDRVLVPELKEDGSPVTRADKHANEIIVGGLSRAFPEDTIVSEEGCKRDGGKRTWYVDPIDGTRGFYKRNGHFAIHIGFCEDELPTLGVVYWPIGGDLYSGVVGAGAWRENSRGIIELRTTGLSKIVASTNGDFPKKDLVPLFKQLDVSAYHNCGGEGLRLMKLAENRASIRVNEYGGASTWDICAPQAILEAAGGGVRYLNGGTIKYTGQEKIGARYVAANVLKLLERVILIQKELNLNQ